MTDHKNIRNPDNYSKDDYKKWEYLLFDDETPPEELEEIVMILAHLPTQRAKKLLEEFGKTERAEEISWVEMAAAENRMWLLWPETEQEETDVKTLKLHLSIQNQIADAQFECEKAQYRIDLNTIELTALEKLSEKEPSDEIAPRITALEELIRIDKDKLEKLNAEVSFNEKLSEQILKEIKTKKYKSIDPWSVQNFHFDGEE